MDAAPVRDYVIVPATDLHVGPHVAHLTEQERADLAQLGWRPRDLIRRFLRQSSYARSAILGGVPVAMWGVTGASMESTGYVWLSLTPEARERKFALLRETMRELAQISATKRVVESLITITDARALRFAQSVGFGFGEHKWIEARAFVPARLAF